MSERVVSSCSVSYSQSLVPGPLYSPRKLPPHGRGWIYLWLSIIVRTWLVVGLMLGSVFIIELDAGLAGIYFHRYCTGYDVCHNASFTPNSFAVRSPKCCGTGSNCVRTDWTLWQLFRVFYELNGRFMDAVDGLEREGHSRTSRLLKILRRPSRSEIGRSDNEMDVLRTELPYFGPTRDAIQRSAVEHQLNFVCTPT